MALQWLIFSKMSSTFLVKQMVLDFCCYQNKFIDRRDQLRYASENASPIRLRVISPNHRSTRFTHEELVGVKCR